ncbi:sensor histidine kinase [Christensenella intestinihominis]|uniref:sensor histidine kinase n=1 Tax=Christensenella intestinihominis TaxID=1851429 RepID=UPI000A6BBF14|nr:HAMP domain-containing sensor histidine kinase [Christensenella intestinihominis]
MKLRDIDVRKKIMLTNFMMIVIPVLIILLVTVGILIGILTGAGSSVTIAAAGKWAGETTNYQLQLMIDSLSEDLVENKNAFREGSPFLEICLELEKIGVNIAVSDETGVRYVSPGAAPGQLERQADALHASQTPSFVRTQEGFASRTVTESGNGTFSIVAAAPGLAYPAGEYYAYDSLKAHLKAVLVIVGTAAIVIIILTGIDLSKRLSRSILAPVRKLGEATFAVRSGNLDHPVGYASGDELGQVCEEFDEMRLRLKESKQAEKRYEQQRKQMIAGISHDLSTPLTAIKGYVSGILDGIADTPEKREHYLRTIYDRACDMDKMVDSLFLFSKLDLDQEPFHMERVDLAAYFKDWCKEAREKLPGMEIAFHPGPCASAPVLVDRLQFDRVVANLLDNSIKYRKGDSGKIEISLRCTGNTVALDFQDDGIGIAEGETEKIFESFYRTDPARGNAAGGSGLGLAIVRRIVERMGGRVSAHAREGGGLRMTIALPKAEGDV